MFVVLANLFAKSLDRLTVFQIVVVKSGLPYVVVVARAITGSWLLLATSSSVLCYYYY